MLNYVKIYINRKYKVWWSLPLDVVCIIHLVNLITYVKITRINDINKLISVKIS